MSTIILKDGRHVDLKNYIKAKTLDLRDSISQSIEADSIEKALAKMERKETEELSLIDILVREDFHSL